MPSRRVVSADAAVAAPASEMPSSGALSATAVGIADRHSHTIGISGQPRYDAALARLPAAAARKLVRLIEAQHELGVLAREVGDRHDRARDRRARLMGHLDEARAANIHNEGMRQHIDRTGTELGVVQGEVDQLAERSHRLAERQSRLPSNILDWLTARPAATFVIVEPLEAKPAKGEMAVQAVARVREKLAELAADAHEVRSRPVPSSVAIARMKHQVTELARLGEPDVLRAVEIGAPVSFPRLPIATGLLPVPVAVDHTLAYVTWLFEDVIVARLSSAIVEMADDAVALDDDERAAKEREIASKIHETERIEEVLIEAIEAEGGECCRRDNADPCAVLGIVVTRPARP